MTTKEIKTLLYNIFGSGFVRDYKSKPNFCLKSKKLKILVVYNNLDIYGSYFNIYFDYNIQSSIQQKLNNSKYGYIQQRDVNCDNVDCNCIKFYIYNELKNIDI